MNRIDWTALGLILFILTLVGILLSLPVAEENRRERQCKEAGGVLVDRVCIIWRQP